MLQRYCSVVAIFLITVTIESTAQRKNVILYIGDGFGVAPKTATRMALGQGRDGKRFSTDPQFQILAADKLKYTAMVTTHSRNSWITDSAPGATVYAAGQAGKIDNEALSFNLETNQPVQTILEAAKKAGYAVGLVTTTRITHATPAGFASHVWNRDLEDYIAAQFLSTSQGEYEALFNSAGNTYNVARDWELPAPKVGVEVDVLLGGGARHFLGKNSLELNNIVRDRNGAPITKTNGDTVKLGSGRRGDAVDLVEMAKSRGYTYVNSRDAILHLDLSQFTGRHGKKLLGLFRDSHMSYEQDRQLSSSWEPTLHEMTRIAIEVLQRKGNKGFFLLVEGGRIDHLAHANAGGVSIESDEYVIESDEEAVADDQIYSGSMKRQPGVYGSDYIIKEVLAFDYAIEEGRKLLKAPSKSSQTLIFAASDHETGGIAVVGLHDEGNTQRKGAKIRTYAQEPRKSNNEFTPSPVSIQRGDASIGGWFPEYTMVDFQGTLWPQASPTGRRIVIAYGSNPLTNGNGEKIGGGIGNHTPVDIWVGADDNVGGKHASKIAGRGLLDNTDIFPLMCRFLKVTTMR